MRLRSRRAHGIEVAIEDEYALEDPTPAAARRGRRRATAARAGAVARRHPQRAVAVPRRGLHPRGDRGADAAHRELLQIAARARQPPPAPAAGRNSRRGSGAAMRTCAQPRPQHSRCVMPDFSNNRTGAATIDGAPAGLGRRLRRAADGNATRATLGNAWRAALDARPPRTRHRRGASAASTWLIGVASAAVLALAVWAPLSRWLQADGARSEPPAVIAQAVPGMRRPGRADPRGARRAAGSCCRRGNPGCGERPPDAQPPSPPIASPCAATAPLQRQARGIAKLCRPRIRRHRRSQHSRRPAPTVAVAARPVPTPICCRN